MTERARILEALRWMSRSAGVDDAELAQAVGPLAQTDAIRATAGLRSGVVALLGSVGEGKTLAATRWLLEPFLELSGWNHDGGTWFPARRPTVLFRTAKDLTRVSQYDRDDVEPLFIARRLVLDDLGQEYADKKGFLASLVDEIITERHRRKLPSVLTSNLKIGDFEERYGARVLDRIAGSGKIVICQGSSLRRRAPTPNVPALFQEADIEARLAECAAELRAKVAEAQALLEAAPAASEVRRSIHGSTAPLGPDQVAARKAEIARRLADWSAKNGGGEG